MNPILIGVLAFLMFCVVWMKVTKPVEGFTSGNTPKDVHKKIQGSVNEMNDALALTTYRQPYEDSILELEKWTDNSMLKIIADGSIGTESADKQAESIRLFNDLAILKTNLSNMIAVLDKKD